MNNTELEYHSRLMSTYLFCKSLYSFSFKERVSIDLDMIMFTPSFYNKDLDNLSNEELEKKLSSLKKPWWNDFYEKKVRKNKKLLLLIFLLFLRRDYSWYGLKQIYKAIKTDKKEFGD